MTARARTDALRARMAYEAARIMIEQGLSDFDRARRKAATRTGIRDRRHWPDNETVQEALLTQRRLFRDDDAAQLRRMREAAAGAMRNLADFSPRLVGAALQGVGDPSLGVELLLYAERPEDVLFRLHDQGIPWDEGERTLRYPGGARNAHPAFSFVAGDQPFELIVLPPRARRQPPLDPVDDRPWRGADLPALERLLAEPGV
ncbi:MULTISPECIES: hypothetical protein [Marichromatium]|uniref:Nucleotidyltransferase-like protein n=1 Tax=Marichromatium gracile TaxID=1048 RepID=A0A4R4AKH1_MARGR|nr:MULTISPECIES: hypothetical protein [Marichromatium]MBO8085202.1 hypothetical protein [Marichromatium sp.]MBK1707562.1 hypothetical protein [Marichromatium gracile]RNE91968.1 hypothetical protein EBL84_00650 [Marichromatium sp. AB31]RNE92921.1 hypothetical protein EBL85_09650 [Marichromatium sp. AB32]TCW39912.1 hypothetical protein EDC29_101328 [Marichromatium gracile]